MQLDFGPSQAGRCLNLDRLWYAEWDGPLNARADRGHEQTAVALFGVVIAIAAWVAASDWEERLAKTKFNDVAGDCATVLQNGLDHSVVDRCQLRAWARLLFQPASEGERGRRAASQRADQTCVGIQKTDHASGLTPREIKQTGFASPHRCERRQGGDGRV